MEPKPTVPPSVVYQASVTMMEERTTQSSPLTSFFAVSLCVHVSGCTHPCVHVYRPEVGIKCLLLLSSFFFFFKAFLFFMCVSPLPACLCEHLPGTQRSEVDIGSPGTGVTGKSGKYSQLHICLFSLLYLTPTKYNVSVCIWHVNQFSLHCVSLRN